MHTFEFIQPANSAEAMAVAAHAKTAQQGADVRFVAGGTTLLDLMKLNVETPARVIDINRLPLDKIEASGDGGEVSPTRSICRYKAMGLGSGKTIGTT